jgi:hypothetical protein
MLSRPFLALMTGSAEAVAVWEGATGHVSALPPKSATPVAE